MSDSPYILRSSGAPQWGKCSGSLTACMSVPDVETQEKREGTASHWVGSECLDEWASPQGSAAFCSAWIGRVAPNGVVIDEKMAEGAQVWVSDVLQVCQTHGALRQLMVEQPVAMPQIHEKNGGTLDTALWLPDKRVLFHWDYKHGHRECKAVGNLQSVDYIAGLMDKLELHGEDDTQITVVSRIVQPFCYQASAPIGEWIVKLSDLRGYFNQLHGKAHEALTGGKFTAGEHCRDCAAVGRCATARRAAISAFTYANELPEINLLSGADLGLLHEQLKEGVTVVKAVQEAVEDELNARIRAGAVDTGLALATKYGRLNWTAPVSQVIALAQAFGVDASKDAVKTPTQVKDLVEAGPKRKAFEQVLKTVAERPVNGAKLIPASDTIGAHVFKKKG